MIDLDTLKKDWEAAPERIGSDSYSGDSKFFTPAEVFYMSAYSEIPKITESFDYLKKIRANQLREIYRLEDLCWDTIYTPYQVTYYMLVDGEKMSMEEFSERGEG